MCTQSSYRLHKGRWSQRSTQRDLWSILSYPLTHDRWHILCVHWPTSHLVTSVLHLSSLTEENSFSRYAQHSFLSPARLKICCTICFLHKYHVYYQKEPASSAARYKVIILSLWQKPCCHPVHFSSDCDLRPKALVEGPGSWASCDCPLSMDLCPNSPVSLKLKTRHLG